MSEGSGAARVISCHDAEPGWPWLAPLYHGKPDVDWHSISTRRSSLIRQLPGPHIGRVRAALQLRRMLSRGEADLIVSHGPYTSYYVEALGRGSQRTVPHLAFAFNFTDIPGGYRLDAMRRAFPRIDRLVVYSRMERQLYSDVFGIPEDRLTFMRWGVAPPIVQPKARTIRQPYVVAIGGEARDYATLCDAARRLPQVSFVLIVRPHSLSCIDVPANVDVRVNLAWDETWSLLWHAEAGLLPLRSSQTPNGHVTLVGGMHIGKAQVVTDSEGIRDYAEHERTALLVPARDPAAFATAIERLLDDSILRRRLGRAAQSFAAEHCSEAVTVEAFSRQLIDLIG